MRTKEIVRTESTTVVKTSGMSFIIAQDITTIPSPLEINRSSLNGRDLIVTRAFENEPWHSGESAASLVEQKLCQVDRDLLYQILMVENTSKSKLSQIDDMNTKLDPRSQKVDRIKTGKEKVVINQVNVDSDESPTDGESQTNRSQAQSRVVFKLVLQDRNGSLFYAINSTPLPWLHACMLGSKIVVRQGAYFNRGVFILREACVMFLGGINRVWNENRDAKLCEYLEAKLQKDNGQKTTHNNKKRQSTG
ncbi:RMI1 (YPL024W) [Zygosaccharomyces parabailii]|uniref:ZYBA0S07-01332g1_1 n=1 Tax=Zygosaccharomyces bailii (strain CLIB 213 / ATCC 58445 / CBS 680 / BCRC 21525 / NBRC 1098 / NCYC 1416 / NRRL Y-2227) TaxID=1333698 RepID=A0A8J2T8Y2_ZYGB2|nr:RMI1 (YPL024W) [Zygosaccharomyces parabailii]CDF90452.1 ZYBA0S07-01332g1_1 [Zygosaccharomyces bailii CLIB 213]CDH10784.1 related to RecQ-mediated genome instability protein 1 [Zygosaccharomyces bailii ISA1307]